MHALCVLHGRRATQQRAVTPLHLLLLRSSGLRLRLLTMITRLAVSSGSLPRLLSLALLVCGGDSLDNGVARLPPMGWNSWYDLGSSPAMNESMVMQTADAMVTLGLPRLGYTYINLDDGYVEGRDATTGKLFADRQRFPSGMANLSRYVHDRGLRFGVYTARCAQTCCLHPASLGHEELDARTMALDWNVDFIKEDSCAGCPAGALAD
jgi:alpha-galactosidase